VFWSTGWLIYFRFDCRFNSPLSIWPIYTYDDDTNQLSSRDRVSSLLLSQAASSIRACSVATSCCISDVPSQREGQKFDLLQLSHFPTDLFETQNQERYLKCVPACKILFTWDNAKKVCENSKFWLFVVFTSRQDYTVRRITTNEGSKRVFLRKCCLLGVSMTKT